MSASKYKLWFSLLHGRDYKGTEAHFPPVSHLKGIQDLENNSQIVLSELKNYLDKFVLESQFNVMMVEKPKTWKVRSLRVWGVEMYEFQKYFPETIRLLSNIDGVVNVGFNLLEPQSSIKSHCGDTNAIIRCHLGLVIPNENENCAIKVNGEIKNWQQGKVLGFIDAYNHEAWNRTNEQRIIMLFDMLIPEFQSQKNKICGVVLTSFYMQQLGNFFPKLYNLNPVWLYPITYPLSYLIRILIPIRNYLKK